MSDEHKYDNVVQPNNKFGHTLALLEQHLPQGVEGAVHLDLACGYGHIADPIMEKFGLHYVGVDIDEDELEVVRERGLEAHAADLSSQAVAERLRDILQGRRVASVTFLDGLEHMTDGTNVLRAVSDLLAENRAVAITSVPNVTHFDVGMKTLLGSWTYTEAGLLDYTHYQLFSEESLDHLLAVCGLRRFDTNDVHLGQSDQFFPVDHSGLNPGTPMSKWLRAVRDVAEPNQYVNQFVWALTAAPAVGGSRLQTPVEDHGDVFLSVVMRTQGRRPQELREALLCLAGQTCDDFEVLVIAHKTTVKEQKAVELIIEEQPPFLRERIRLLLLDRGQRSAPLNLGLEESAGRYIAIFDDDDVVMGDWVNDFKKLEREARGQVLRTIALRQSAEVSEVLGHTGIRSTSAPVRMYAKTFSLTEHLVENQSPPIGWIFPRSLVTDFGLRYDESMTTTEDWEFLLRAAEIAGVKDVGRGTAIYRWWEKRESSRTEHGASEWAQNQSEIERRVDAKPFLLPAGETRELRESLKELRQLRKQNRRQQRYIGQLESRQARHLAQINRLRGKVTRLRGKLGQGGQGSGAGPDRPPAQPPTIRQRLRPRTRMRALLARFRG